MNPQKVSIRILFVDDVVDTRTLYAFAFKLDGHSTRLAADGEEAIIAVQDELFDAIVMDVGLPRLNGWDTTRIIRQLPHGLTVPILMFTGFGHDYSTDDAVKAAGANGILRKPMDPSQLLHHIQALASAGKSVWHLPSLPRITSLSG